MFIYQLELLVLIYSHVYAILYVYTQLACLFTSICYQRLYMLDSTILYMFIYLSYRAYLCIHYCSIKHYCITSIDYL